MNQNRAVITGVAGELRWVFHKAATLGPWRIVSEGVEVTLTAPMTAVDAYRIAQHPLTFVVPRPKGAPWRWPIVSLQIADDRVTAALGPLE